MEEELGLKYDQIMETFASLDRGIKARKNKETIEYINKTSMGLNSLGFKVSFMPHKILGNSEIVMLVSPDILKKLEEEWKNTNG